MLALLRILCILYLSVAVANFSFPFLFFAALDEKREPLWRRDMPGLKHIRGILYEEYPEGTVFVQDNSTSSTNFVNSDDISIVSIKNDKNSGSTVQNSKSTGKNIDEVDNFPMKCRECGLQKKTIKGLKMHIKLLHLRTGRFGCSRCEFSANIMNSITTHYKIKHPEAAENPDFEERSDEKMIFSHEFWKEKWGIPTLNERKAIVHKRRMSPDQFEIMDIDGPLPKKFKKGGKKGRKPGVGGKKTGVKRKLDENAPLIQPESKKINLISQITANPLNPLLTPMDPSEKPLSIMEISPFESHLTYKCQYCSKRTNDLEKIDTHLKIDHPNKVVNTSEDQMGYKIMSRDQVVDMLTHNLAAMANIAAFICYFCEDVIGRIEDLKGHFNAEHTDEIFRVKRVQDVCKKPISGYLECQLCGYLTPGFDRSKQRVHFHDEHPLEQSINCSKYVSKGNKQMSQVKIEAFDPLKYLGMSIKCPKEDCGFENTSNAAMNAHLRKHTQTFKCGHCGKTHPNSSEFHRHSAMLHGDK